MADFDIAFDNDELDVSYSQDTFEVNFTTNTEFSASFTAEEFQVDFSESGHQGPSGNNAQYVFFFVTEASDVDPGNPTENPDNWTAEADIEADAKVFFWAVAEQQVNPDGSLVPIVASDWRIVAFPGALDPAEVRAAVNAYFEDNPIVVVSTDADNAITSGTDDLAYYDDRGKANLTDLATFKDFSGDNTSFRLDEIEISEQSTAHIHDLLFKFENADGDIGIKAVRNQASIADGQPATLSDLTTGENATRYVNVNEVRSWASNEFLEDNQLLLSSDSSDTATVTGIAEVPTADWINNVWRPHYIPAGDRPTNWNDLSKGVKAFDTDTAYSPGYNFTFNNILYKINGNVADGTTFANAADAIAASTQLLDGNLGGGGLDITPYDENASYTINDYVRDTDGVLHRFISTTVTNGPLINTAIWQTVGGANQIGPATQDIGDEDRGSIPANTEGARVSLGANNQLLNVPNGAFDIYGTGGIDVTVEESRVIVDGSGIEGGGDIDILDLETVYSFTDSTLGQDLVGYVTSTLHGTATVAPQSNGSYEITNHTLTTGDYYIFTWASSYAIGLATSETVFATVETHLATGDALPTLNQQVEIVNLVNVHRQELPVENQLDIISNSQAISLINQEIGVTYDEVDEDEVALRIALGSATNAQGEQSNPASIDGEDPEYLFGAGHVLIWYVTLTANTEATTADQRSALELAVHNRREFAVTPSGTITDVNVNDSTVYHFTLTTIHDFGDDAAGNETFQLRAVLVDPTRNDAFRTAFGLVGPDPLHYPDRYHFATQNVIFDHIQVLESRIVTNVGIDTALRTQPATVATDAAWLAYINGLGITGDVTSGTQFPAVADHTVGDLFVLTEGHTEPADDDLIYVGIYTLVQNTPTNEWVHLTEYKTTTVELAYPSGARNESFYGNKGVEDLAQDVINTAARVYTEMNTALGTKQDTITTTNAPAVRTALGGIYLNPTAGDVGLIPKVQLNGTWALAPDNAAAHIPDAPQDINTSTTDTGFTVSSPTKTDSVTSFSITGASAAIIAAGIVEDAVVQLGTETNSRGTITSVTSLANTSLIEVTDLDDHSVDASTGDAIFIVTTDASITTRNYSLNVLADNTVSWQESTSGGEVPNALRYALLLTNGFLLPENTAMSTDDRDAYTDTTGAYGNANTVYWFDNTNDGWYNVSTGGTALISFPA